MTKFQSIFEDFQSMLGHFEEILREEKTDIVRDSAIKRFELTFDLAWKTLKAFLEEYHNATCVSPRTCFREAFRLELLAYDEYLLTLTSVRNYTVHTYHEAFAEKIYQKLPDALAAFKKLEQAIQKNQ